MNEVVVIMPTYNRANIISNSIRSVINQTFGSFELVIIDDGSLDNTDEVVKSFNDDRIHFIKLEKNMGANHARNVGLHYMTSKFVAFLDSDNVWDGDFLKKGVARLERDDSELFFCRAALNYASKKEVFPNSKHTADELSVYNGIRDLLCFGNAIDLNTLIVRTDRMLELDGFDETMKRFQDYELVVRLFEKEIKYSFCDEVLVDNYIQKDSISLKNNLFWEARAHILREQMEYCRKRNIVYDVLYYLINELIPQNPDDEAERKILNCLSQDDFIGIFSRLKEKDSYMDMLNMGIDNLNAVIEIQNKTISMKRWVIDATQLNGSSKIAVYGFGDVGKDIVNQLSRIHDYEIVAIYDSNYKKDTRLSDPKEIAVCEFDYVIVTPINAEVYNIIKKNLIEMGIPEKKIIIAKNILQGVEKNEN